MARATLVCCVLSVFVICLLLFFVVFLFVCCCRFFVLFCFVLFCLFFFLGGGGCFVLLLFCYGFIWLVLDALDLVRNTKKEFCANRICAHKGPQGSES